MRLRPDQLAKSLSQRLLPVYLLSGDEPLQLNESADAIRRVAREAGYQNRVVLEVSTGFRWDDLLAEANSLSLFAEKKLLDVRIPNGKPGREGSKALDEYCANVSADNLLLLTLPKLDKSQQSSKWFKRIEQVGGVVQIWPISPQQLPRWIDQRLRQVGLIPDAEAAKMLADRVEGNLLAAQQEIEKLRLIHDAGHINVDQLLTAVTDNARYDVFELVDTALRQQPARCIKVLQGLRAEGVAAPIVLWALHREIAQLSEIALQAEQNPNLEQVLARARVWEKRKGLIRQAIQRQSAQQWLILLSLCQIADASIKGANQQEPWRLLEDICLGLCAHSALV
jgi:DNA polymerase-3 subunit delta